MQKQNIDVVLLIVIKILEILMHFSIKKNKTKQKTNFKDCFQKNGRENNKKSTIMDFDNWLISFFYSLSRFRMRFPPPHFHY